jgi:dipeptidyl-peptidase 4
MNESNMNHRWKASGLIPILTALVLLPVALMAPAAEADAQEMPRTWQEQNNFRSGPTPFEPLMEFWYELARVSPKVNIEVLTHTLEDREFTLVTVANTPDISPQDAIRSGKTIVLIANAVHGNEPAGKEASQLVARELVAGDLQHLLDDIIVLFIPLVNPDGGEIPRRTNTEGFDMNRDYIKLESQEIHAMVTKVLTQWTPDIHVDTHHGGRPPYTLTWQGTLNPAADAELRAYPYDVIFPRFIQALRAEDYDGFDYSGPQTRGGVQGWGSTSVEPRKHHVYTGLINSIGILFETPGSSHRVRNNGTTLEAIPQGERYYHQVRGQHIAMRELFTIAAENREEIRALTNASRERAIRNGLTYSEADQVVIDYDFGGNRGNADIWMPDSDAELGYSLENVPVFLEHTPSRTTPRALGYVLPIAMAKIVPLLQDHGITVYRFTENTELDLEVYRATEIRRDSYFQGSYLKSVSVEKQNEQLTVQAGSYYIPTGQALGNLISYIMEPETDDNLITWGYTDHILQVGTPNNPPRVPMMRVVRDQPMSLLRVVPFNEFSPNRYYQPW